jgi:nicotinamide riboside transporter PnuC
MLDWVGMVLTLLGSFSVIYKIKYGFLIMLVGCLFWIGYGVNINSLAVIITNIVFSGTNIYGFWKWDKEEK